MKKSKTKQGIETRAIHAGQQPDPTTGAIMTPIYATSTYVQESPGVHKGFEYSRTHNPTRFALEDCVADLENGEKGFAFASGLACMGTLLELLDSGDHVIAIDDLYGGSYRLFEKVRKRTAGLECSFIDLSDPTLLESEIRENTRMSFDITMHSATKYLNGHSDVIGGIAVIAPGREELKEQLEFLQNAVGSVLSPFDSFMVLRALKTLPVRMERHCSNAIKIARFLENHSAIEKVYYPGLESHSQHALALKQMPAFGGMVTAVLGEGLEKAKSFLEKCQIFSLAESLGGVESLIEHPAIMTHASIPKEIRKTLGISDGLVRLSVGIENVDDLIEDLDQALQ